MKAVIRFADARQERPRLHDKLDLLLGIVATLEAWVGSRLLYAEEMFPIVEFRVALAAWLDSAIEARRDFEFRSMESDEDGLLWLRRVDNGWRIGSIHQEFPATATLTDEEVAELARRFIEDVDQWVLEHCDVRVSSFL